MKILLKISLLTLAVLSLVQAFSTPASAAFSAPVSDEFDCGVFGYEEFQVNIGPFVGVAAGLTDEAIGKACDEALAKVALALFAEANAQGIEVPDCPKEEQCPAPIKGCDPSIQVGQIPGELAVKLGRFYLPFVGWFVTCTATVKANATAETGCTDCEGPIG